MSATKRTLTKSNATLGREHGIWIHPVISRNASVPALNVHFGLLAQKLQPYLDQILSFEKKKGKPKKQGNRTARRKHSRSKHLVKRQKPRFSSSHMRPSRMISSRIRKTHKSERKKMNPSPEEPIVQQSEERMPEGPQLLQTEPLLPSPPPVVPEMIETETVRTESLFCPPEEPIVQQLEDALPEGPQLESEPFPPLPQAYESEMMETDTVRTESISFPTEELPQSDLETASPAAENESLFPQTVATLKNDPVVYPKIPFLEEQDGSFVLVSLLEEIWNVDWEHPVSIKWGQKWSELRYEIEVEPKDIRHNQSGLILWISGNILLSRIGTAQGDSKVLHETLTIPFSTTILHPSLTKSSEEKINPQDLPPYHDKIWTETGDWKAMLMANPLKMASSDTQECDGFIHITGRIWWFRKQLLPLRNVKENDQV